MHYKFPEIRTIDDVLPHVEGRSEFIVAEREGFTVINYVVAYPETFAMHGLDDLGGAIRRECRGIIFGEDGYIMSRPFHKFFNVNERDETQAHVLDMTAAHVIMEKMDGSMIRPVRLNGMVRLATKMGITDIAEEAEQLLTGRQLDWLDTVMLTGVTPLFEYISPTNKIVIEYSEPQLVLLAMRNNVTGNYYMPHYTPFEVVPQYGSVEGGLSDYITRAREMQGREGDIIRFANGHMLKVKNDWYVRIHKTKDIVRVDRNIVELVLNEELDDILPLLDAPDRARVDQVEYDFWSAFENAEGRLIGLDMIARTVYGGDKKRVALEMVPNLLHHEDSSFIFRMLSGQQIRPILLDYCKKHIGSTPKYESLMEWMVK